MNKIDTVIPLETHYTETFTYFVSQILRDVNILNREVNDGWILLNVECVLGESLEIYKSTFVSNVIYLTFPPI